MWSIQMDSVSQFIQLGSHLQYLCTSTDPMFASKVLKWVADGGLDQHLPHLKKFLTEQSAQPLKLSPPLPVIPEKKDTKEPSPKLGMPPPKASPGLDDAYAYIVFRFPDGGVKAIHVHKDTNVSALRKSLVDKVNSKTVIIRMDGYIPRDTENVVVLWKKLAMPTIEVLREAF